MASPVNVIGIDVGSVSIAIVEVSPEKEILRTWYDFHHGRVEEAVARILSDADMQNASIGSILIIGAEKFGLLLFDEDGSYLK